ncbi:MAG: hypothetical protein LBF67_03595 [Prevotellaceae bacterium]|nr:hypothetical protein [Prevotellaceae bacterium]
MMTKHEKTKQKIGKQAGAHSCAAPSYSGAKPYQTHDTWTSDGEWIIFRSARSSSQLFVVSEATGGKALSLMAVSVEGGL